MEGIDKTLNNYLEQIEKYLKPIEVSERIDIVKEIQSEMLELQQKGVSSEQIIERLGSPTTLAKASLGESISKNSRLNWRKVSALLAFYSLVGLGGMMILPVISICAAVFLLTGALCPIAGIVKYAAHLQGYEISQIGIQLNHYEASATAFLPISFIIGFVLMAVGWLFWKLTLITIRSMYSGKKKLNQL